MQRLLFIRDEEKHEVGCIHLNLITEQQKRIIITNIEEPIEVK